MSASLAEIEELVVALKKRNARAAKRIAELHVRNAARVALESGKEDNHD
jgi:DNA-binding GntR family transcriptional regulator